MNEIRENGPVQGENNVISLRPLISYANTCAVAYGKSRACESTKY